MSFPSLKELYECIRDPSLLVKEGLVSGKPVKSKGARASFFLCGAWSCLQKCDIDELNELINKMPSGELKTLAIDASYAFATDKVFAKFGVDCHLAGEDEEGNRKSDVVMMNRLFRFLVLRLVVEAKAVKEDLPDEVKRSAREATPPDEYPGEAFDVWWERIGKSRAVDDAFRALESVVGQHILDSDDGPRKWDMIKLLNISFTSDPNRKAKSHGTYNSGITFDFQANYRLYTKFSNDVRDVFCKIKWEFDRMEMATESGRHRAKMRLQQEEPESFGDEPVRAARDAMLRSINSTSLPQANDLDEGDKVTLNFVNCRKVGQPTLGTVLGFGNARNVVMIKPHMSHKVHVVDARHISKSRIFRGR